MLNNFVISEIVNRTLRIEHDKYLLQNGISKQNLPLKKYRDSADGQSVLTDIYLIINTNILTTFSVIGKSFTKSDIQSLLIADHLDFGDKGIQLICIENSYVLLTNDIDLKNSSIDILTSNPAILRN